MVVEVVAGIKQEPQVALVAPELSNRYTRGNPRMLAHLQKRVAATVAASDVQSTEQRLRVFRECW